MAHDNMTHDYMALLDLQGMQDSGPPSGAISCMSLITCGDESDLSVYLCQ